jgi:predicted CopG family antitoxin
MHDSRMSKTITIDDDAYRLLSGLKTGPRDSFTQVILRHIRRPAATCGSLLHRLETGPRPEVDADLIDRMISERGRRSRRP